MQTKPKPDFAIIGLLLLCGAGLGLSLSGAAGFAVMALMGQLEPGASTVDAHSLMIFAWINAAIALLTAPAVFWSIRRVLHPTPSTSKPSSTPRNRFLLASLALLTWPLLLAAGNRLGDTPFLNWLLLPPIQILCVALPIWWIVEFARRNLVGGAPIRQWNTLAASFFLATPLIMVIEIILAVAGIGLLALYISSTPALVQHFEALSAQIALNNPANPEEALQIITPLMRQPAFLLIVAISVAGVAPIIEELFKPLMVWLLAGRGLTTQQGFVAGALTGAAFGLLESWLTLGGASGNWVQLVVARGGTGLLHITTAALTGWGIGLATQRNRYGQLAALYLLAVGLHSLWNFFTVAYAAGDLMANTAGWMLAVRGLSVAAPWVLGGLSVSMLGILAWANHKLFTAQVALPGFPAGDDSIL